MTGEAFLRHVRAYASSPDSRVAAGNAVALLVAANQPLYPLYVAWVAGNGWPAVWTFLSTPLFLAVPGVAQRNSLAGRTMLPLAGIANTVLAAWALGVASGVEAFLAPCVVLAGLLFRPTERRVALALIGVALAAFLVLHDQYGTPRHPYSAEDYAALLRLNAISAGGLLAFIGLTFSAAERRA
ncbi:MAG: hypothetical protein U1E59_19470 [Amaricoccus sp.]